MFSTRRALVVSLLAVAVLPACGGPTPEPDPRAPTPSAGDDPVARVREPFTGDLDEILERGMLRVLVSLSRTNFFYRDGRPVGFEAELMRQLEESLNEGVRSPLERLRVVFVPCPYDRLLDDLEAGHGDVVAAAMSVTIERSLRVAFSDPYLPDVEEVVVHHPGVEGLASLADLAGRRVVVRADSSYAEHLGVLDAFLREAGAAGLDVVEADPDLATEDLLQLVAEGAVPLTVADDYLAEAWAQALEGLVVRQDLVLHQGVQIAWAVRRDNPQLRQRLDEFARAVRRGTRLGNVLFSRYHSQLDPLRHPLGDDSRDRLAELRPLFERYGEEYGIPWVALAAQAYRESRFDHSRTSPAGAVGVMQLRPQTASAVGVDDPEDLERNILAGARYLDRLRSEYFDDPAIEPQDRLDLSWAAYNAGPTRIRRLQREAGEAGLDPRVWFGHVEQVAAKRIGAEPVDYVRDINRYYVAFSLALEGDASRRDSLRRLADSP